MDYPKVAKVVPKRGQGLQEDTKMEPKGTQINPKASRIEVLDSREARWVDIRFTLGPSYGPHMIYAFEPYI